jgi:hypothetical protein
MKARSLQNPFFELYVGERIKESDFVKIFCPTLVKHVEALFTPGNVVVTGSQGSGKSMLLSLLKSDVRLAYAAADGSFPVPKELSHFIGAGINLAHSNAIDFGLRELPGIGNSESEVTTLHFGDFVNYGVCLDILRSIQKLGSDPAIRKYLGIDFSEDAKSKFIRSFATDASWMGYLQGADSWTALQERLFGRLSAYRDYLHYNSSELDPAIVRSKSAIGMPIAAMARHLKKSGVVRPDINFFVYIDQFEELANLERSTNTRAPDFRKLINRALARRDPSISYRIGARANAWARGTHIFGSTGRIEDERDYKLVSLNEMLRRPENRKYWIFPEFAADVFTRRLDYAGFLQSGKVESRQFLRTMFGSGISAPEKAKKYAGGSRSRAVKVDADWPEEIKKFILGLAEDDPLSARFSEAWYSQNRKRDVLTLASLKKKPWEAPAAQYWRKERVEHALFQIAGRCAQRVIWTGADDIVELSGGNILVFLSICQHIWAAYMRVEDDRQLDLSKIDDDVQALGIFQASSHWVRKVSQETGRSGDRARFVRWLAGHFGALLMQDRALSNPGFNGFSVSIDDLEHYPNVHEFMSELADYGNLVEVPHTTKEKNRRARLKWYLNPIFCPHFRVPYKRLKEPEYIDGRSLLNWLSEAGVSPEICGSALMNWRAKADPNRETVVSSD